MLRLPNDISLVGFGDLFMEQYTEPPPTTLRQPMRQRSTGWRYNENFVNKLRNGH